MKSATLVSIALLALIFWVPAAGLAQFSPGQSLLGGVKPPGMEDALLAANAPDNAAFADGTRAINESRWADAVDLFTRVAQQKSVHADGALYWKAYAQNKLGQTKPALDTCTQLRHDFPSSSWLHECGALEIEMRAHGGQPAQPKDETDESLRLLALNEMMKHDEPRALAGLQEILNGDASEKLKIEAQFILSQHYSDATYAQIVRISYMEGDVRVARGPENEKATGATWEKAAANLPLESGFSLVTGSGRAEIELEDASTLYLGDHSVLLLNDLHTTSGIPYTELALLTGTVTLNIQPYVAGEVFILKTPTGNVSVKYPEKTYLRVSSYADGYTMATQKDINTDQHGVEKLAAPASQAPVHYWGRGIIWLGSNDAGAFAEWDKWVRDRVTQRTAATAEVMQASGLTEPIPGMAEMRGQGRFFDCQPYGTCWEPNAAAGPPDGDSQPAARLAADQAAGPNTAQSASKKAKSTWGGAAPAASPGDEDEFFPCFPLHSFGYWSYSDEDLNRAGIIDSAYQLGLYFYPYNWAVCHSGGWIHMRNHYVWVAGHKRHHLGPGRWVKCGHTVALVPIHPWDAKGRPPINRKEEILALNHKNGLSFQRANLDPTRSIKLLDAPPKEFNKAMVPTLARAEEPHMKVFLLKDTFLASKTGNKSVDEMKANPAKPVGIPLNFDHKMQSFMVSQQVIQGNHTMSRSVPYNNQGGTLQTRAGSYSGGSGSRSGGFSGGGGARSSSGGNNSRGGGGSNSGSRSGGGSSGSSGGGGSHSSGGSSSSSSSSGAASSSGSSGGGHR
ncbi:MAG: hypothetical protein WAN35_01625 [Terracidiphilus sp.]